MFEIVTGLILLLIVGSLWFAFRATKDNPMDNDATLDQDALNLQEAFDKLGDKEGGAET